MSSFQEPNGHLKFIATWSLINFMEEQRIKKLKMWRRTSAQNCLESAQNLDFWVQNQTWNNKTFLHCQVLAQIHLPPKNAKIILKKALFTKHSPSNCQNCQEIVKNALKKGKIARRHIILPKQRKSFSALKTKCWQEVQTRYPISES